MLPLLTGLGARALVCAASAGSLSPHEVVGVAAQKHPDVVSARAAVDVADGARRDAAGFLGDPEVQVGLSAIGDLSFVQASQPISVTGEGWAARDAAREALEAARLQLRWVELQVAADARQAWVDAAVAGRRAALTADAREGAVRLRDAVRARAAQGDVSAVDSALSRAGEAERTALALDARLELADALEVLAAYHPVHADTTVDGQPSDAVPEPSEAPAVRPDVAAGEAASRAGHAGVRRERRAGLPPVGLGVTAQSDGGAVDVGPLLTVAVPLWNRNPSGVARAEAERDNAIAGWWRTEQQARTAAEATQDALQRTDGWIDRLDGADADLAAALDAVVVAVEAGELDVRDAVLLQGALLDGRLAAIEAAGADAALRLEALLAVGDPALLAGGGR